MFTKVARERAPGWWVGRGFADNNAETACPDGPLQHGSTRLVLVFSIIFKVSLSNQIQETGSSVDIPRLLSAVAFLLWTQTEKGLRIF
jgi:hypothetical protein